VRFEGAERLVLQAIHDLQGESANYVDDKGIADKTRIDLRDVRDWLETLEGKDFIQRALTTDGQRAYITSKGRLALKQNTNAAEAIPGNAVPVINDRSAGKEEICNAGSALQLGNHTTRIVILVCGLVLVIGAIYGLIFASSLGGKGQNNSGEQSIADGENRNSSSHKKDSLYHGEAKSSAVDTAPRKTSSEIEAKLRELTKEGRFESEEAVQEKGDDLDRALHYYNAKDGKCDVTEVFVDTNDSSDGLIKATLSLTTTCLVTWDYRKTADKPTPSEPRIATAAVTVKVTIARPQTFGSHTFTVVECRTGRIDGPAESDRYKKVIENGVKEYLTKRWASLYAH
jgi:hypothetical protein